MLLHPTETVPTPLLSFSSLQLLQALQAGQNRADSIKQKVLQVGELFLLRGTSEQYRILQKSWLEKAETLAGRQCL